MLGKYFTLHKNRDNYLTLRLRAIVGLDDLGCDIAVCEPQERPMVFGNRHFKDDSKSSVY